MALWQPSEAFAFQSAHVFAGAYLFSVARQKWGTVKALRLCLTIMVVKEFVIDPLMEGDSFENGVTDCVQYLAGLAIAFAVQKLVRRRPRQPAKSV